jgi:hypothetical protein
MKKILPLARPWFAVLLVASPMLLRGVTISANSWNWAGYEIVNRVTPPINGAAATITVPTMVCPVSGESWASFWVGIGGRDKDYSLPQVGFTARCKNGMAGYEAWSQWYDPKRGNHDIPFKTLEVKSGERVSLGIEAFTDAMHRAVPGKYTATFVVQNGSQPFSASKVLEDPHGLPISDTAECVVEDPAVHSGLLPFRHFRTVTFQDCRAGYDNVNPMWGCFLITGSCYYGSSPFKQTGAVRSLTMTRGTKVLAIPGGPKGQFGADFQVTWRGA